MKPTLTNSTAALGRLLALSLPEDNRAQALQRQLQPGQTLSARVLASPQSGFARLELLDTPLLARTNLPLHAGQSLRLEVIRAGLLPELRILSPATPENPAQQVLRQSLPRQIPLLESLQAFQRITRQQPASALPTAVREPLVALTERSLPLSRLTPQRLQHLVQGSGLFTEALLAAGRPPATNDQKVLLWQLLAALSTRRGEASNPLGTVKPAPGTAPRDPLIQLPGGDAGQKEPQPDQQNAEARRALESGLLNRLTRLVEGSLARIHTQQATALPQDDGSPRQAWQVELPITVRDQTETLQLKICQEDASNPEHDARHRWRVQLDFDFRELGALQASVLLEGNKVSTTFWCEHEHTGQKFNLRLPELATAFNKAGLEVVELHARHGIPEQEDPVRPPASLLDERA